MISSKIGVMPLGRPTFDVEFANENLTAMLTALGATCTNLRGPDKLLMDTDATEQALAELVAQEIDQLLILQVTFTDAAMTTKIAAAINVPLAIWSIPEPRVAGRLRLNSLCGLNLASHALACAQRQFSWLYASAHSDNIESKLAQLLSGERRRTTPQLPPVAQTNGDGQKIAASLRERRIGRIGEHPEGFATCRYDANALRDQTGIKVIEFSLNELFDAANKISVARLAQVRDQADALLEGLDEVDQQQLDVSLKLKPALDDLREKHHLEAFAIRCWPETFTEYGGAVCGPVSMSGEAKVPCACEADVYGAATQLILQQVADDAVFLADIVDMDAQDDSGVVWHCGQAPISMASDIATPTATVHTNRRMPLLFEFPLKAGEVTLMRISQSWKKPVMLIAHGRMLERSLAYTGTCGVVRFDKPAGQVLTNIIDTGMEHHIALAYGDHRTALMSTAAALNMPVITIG